MKSGVLIVLLLMLNCPSALAADEANATYKAVSLTNDGGMANDLSSTDLTFKIHTDKHGRTFSFQSECRTMTGKLATTKTQAAGILQVEITILSTRDNCTGTEGDLLNLRAFMRLSAANAFAEANDEIEFVGETGKGLVLVKIPHSDNLQPIAQSN